MLAQLAMILVVETFDGSLLDCAIHPLDLSVGPRLFDLRQSVLDAMFVADAIEDMDEGVAVSFLIGELDAVVGQYDVDGIGNGCDEVAQNSAAAILPAFS